MIPAVRFSGITKRFPGVVALDQVSFDVAAGSCHAICGENGAGKSTLGTILAGIQHADAGELLIEGKRVRFDSPRDALAAGVAMVHQELAFCDNLSVAENLFLGQLPTRRGFVDRDTLNKNARQLLESIGAHIDPNCVVAELGIAQQQLVQIAAAVGSGARVIVFDEPTSSLGSGESEQIFALLAQLRARGVTVLYVSHRMPEIFRLCDTVTVLRDGQHVATRPTESLDEAALVQLMIGRRFEQYFPATDRSIPGSHALGVHGFSSEGKFSNINFALRSGEVVGMAGLVGAGRSEIACALFGLDSNAHGTITVRGMPATIRHPSDAVALGIGFVPEDRKKQGLVLQMRTRENTTLPVLDRLSHWTLVDSEAEAQIAASTLDRVQVRADHFERPTATMSGGNQQKVVLAKWLAAESTILILDEPTRGVDVAAKAELHAWIDRMAANGAAILLISSELPELLNLSHRVLVLREGKLVAELSREEANQDVLLRWMSGLTTTEH